MQDVPYGYCHCGCGQKTKPAGKTDHQSGRVEGEPMKFVFGHSSRRIGYVEEDRGYETPCWIWQGYVRPGGRYGQASWDGKRTTAHRAFYKRYVGDVADGTDLDHLCRVTLCVNPAHLEPVTRSENLRRGSRTKLTADKVREIRSSSERPVDLARSYGVHPNTIHAILSRRNWADV